MKLSDVSYGSIDKLMRRIANNHEITPRELHDKFKAKHKSIPDDWVKKQMEINEGGLHDWFSKSKSKDGKPGWVQSDGSPCANEKGETKTPKCYSSQRLAALKRKGKKGKSLIRSADARKSREDSGQQQKSGAAKPTFVKTFAKKKDFVSSGDKQTDIKREEFVGEANKDACYHKVKANSKVWPSAYASGRLVQCRKKGADNYNTKSTKKEETMHEAQDACYPVSYTHLTLPTNREV